MKKLHAAQRRKEPAGHGGRPVPAHWNVLVFFLMLGCAGAGKAAGRDLVFAITAANAMPLGHVEGNALTNGILKDLGDAIARALDRKPAYLILPRRRLLEALVAGEADIRCYARPEWDNADVHWSKPLIPSGDVVAIRSGARRPAGLQALSGIRIGTVNGYRYPAIEQALGRNFIRDDAPAEDNNLAKLVAGRFEYAVVNKLLFDYYRKTRDTRQALGRDYLVLSQFEAQCAVSKKSPVSPQQLDGVIDRLVGDKSFARILAKYR